MAPDTPHQFEEGTTLDRYLMETLTDYPGATGTFVNLVQSIALAGKLISARVNRAGLAGMLGGTGEVNIQGEFVQKLDRYANAVFLRSTDYRGHTCMVVSEEEGGPVLTPSTFHSGRYCVTVDPLDGSSNIDVNATIGTIFGVFRRRSDEGGEGQLSDVLRPGREQIGAGYIVYGAGTLLVLATDQGVNGFTLDPGIGEFFLSHPSIRIPKATIYSVNDTYAAEWHPGVSRFLEGCRERKLSARYIGSLVADFHRNLLKGGVFLYPATKKAPEGKLRLLYEGFPLAYVVEKAGGAATNGRERILDLQPESLHDRTPLIIGSREDVEEATRLLAE